MDEITARIFSYVDGVKWFTLAPSQYTTGLASSACTVLSVQAAKVLLEIPYDGEPIPESTLTFGIIDVGIAANMQFGQFSQAHKAVDDVCRVLFPGLAVDELQQKFIRHGVFQESLDELSQKYVTSPTRNSWAAVVTKFGVAVCVVCRGDDYWVFDSHGTSTFGVFKNSCCTIRL